MIENFSTFTYLGYIVNDTQKPDLPALLFKEGIYIQSFGNPSWVGWHPFYSEAFFYDETTEDGYNTLAVFPNDHSFFFCYYFEEQRGKVFLESEKKYFFFFDAVVSRFFMFPAPLLKPDNKFDVKYAQGILSKGINAPGILMADYQLLKSKTDNGLKNYSRYQDLVKSLINHNSTSAVPVSLASMGMKSGSLVDLKLFDDWSRLSQAIESEMERINNTQMAIATSVFTNSGVELTLSDDFSSFNQLPALNQFVNDYLTCTKQWDFIGQALFSDKAFMTGQYVVTLECVYTIDRNLNKQSLEFHKDSDGQLLFVSLIMNNATPTPATEWFWDVNPPSLAKAAMYDKVWPPFLKSIVMSEKEKLKTQYGNSPLVIQGNIFPPYACETWVDELVWHSTPLLGRRPEINPDGVLNVFSKSYGVQLNPNEDEDENGDQILEILPLISHLSTNSSTTLSKWLKDNKYEVPLQLTYANCEELYTEIFINKKIRLEDLQADIRKTDWSKYKYSSLATEVSDPDDEVEKFQNSNAESIYSDIADSKLKRVNSTPQMQVKLNAPSFQIRNFMRLWVKVTPLDNAVQGLMKNS